MWKKFAPIWSIHTYFVKSIFAKKIVKATYLLKKILNTRWIDEIFFRWEKVHLTVWKLLRFSLTQFWQKFRENNAFTKKINYELVFSETTFFNFPHCASVHTAQCGNFMNLHSHFFVKNFVKVTVLLKKVLYTEEHWQMEGWWHRTAQVAMHSILMDCLHFRVSKCY